jgi:hypothetical protein
VIERDDSLDPRLERELRQPDTGPDMAGEVMRRLGMTPVSEQVARRRRIRRAVTRIGLCTVALTAAVGGTFWYARVIAAADRAGPTLPSAIRHDIERHAAAFGGAIRTIQDLSPSLDEPGDLPAEPRVRPILGEPPL